MALRYWVNGTGEWSLPNNWASTSGGSPVSPQWTDWETPSSTGGSISEWINPTNAYTEDNNFAQGSSPEETNVPLGFQLSWNNGSSLTSIKLSTTIGASVNTFTVGAVDDLWGRSWTATEFNNGNFKIILDSYPSGSPVNIKQSYGNFGLSIPAGSVINGIEVRVKALADFEFVFVDVLEVRVNYTSSELIPTSSDDVIFDVNSFSANGQRVGVSGIQACKSIDVVSLSHDAIIGNTTRNSTSNYINIYGDVELSEKITIQTGLFFASNANLTSNGASYSSVIGSFSGLFGSIVSTLSNVTLTIQDDITNGSVAYLGFLTSITNSTINVSGLEINSVLVGVSAGSTLSMVGTTLNLNPATINNGLTRLSVSSSGTINTSNSEINVIQNTSTTQSVLSLGGKTYNNFNIIARRRDSFIEIRGSNTFNVFTANLGTLSGSGIPQIRFSAGTTQTVAEFEINGDETDYFRLRSTVSGTRFTINSPRTIERGTFLDVLDSNGTGATWYAGADSVDSGNNVGWVFDAPTYPLTSTANIIVTADVPRPQKTANISSEANIIITANSNLIKTVIREVLPDKLYEFKVYDKGQYIGSWHNFTNEPSYLEEINTSGSDMEVILPRNSDSVRQILSQWIDEDEDNIVDEDGNSLIFELTTRNSVGPGTDVDTNYDVDLWVFYGQESDWIIETGEQIVDEDNNVLVFEEGAPNGRVIFRGYISRFSSIYGQQEQVRINLIGYGKELNDYIIEQGENSIIVQDSTNGSFGFPNFAPDTNFKMGQTFEAPTTGGLSRISARLRLGFTRQFPALTVRLSVYSGGTPGSGSLLGSVDRAITNSSFEDINFAFSDPPMLTNGQDYWFELEVVDPDGVVGTQGTNFPVEVASQTGNPYADGDAYTFVFNSSTWFVASNTDLAFSVFVSDSETRAVFNSEDPSDIMRAIVDEVGFKGSKLQYSSISIVDTETTVSYTFNNNSSLEGARKVLDLTPDFWWWGVDQSTNDVILQPRNTEADHTFTLGREIESVDLAKTIESIINVVHVAGGGDPRLFRKYTDQQSINENRRGLFKVSDLRLTVGDSVDIIGERTIAQNKDPRYQTEITILARQYDIETIRTGQTVRFKNFDNFVDDLPPLQIVRRRYRPDAVTLTLDTAPPDVNKRIEDIARNLDTLLQDNLPDSPS